MAQVADDALRGRVVVITGAARGMGRAYLDAFVGRGARVAALDRSWADAPSPPPGVLTLTTDIVAPEEVAVASSRTVDHFGRVDVLINNAALRQRDLYPPHGAARVLETSTADWERMFAVNVIGVLNVIRAFVPSMRAQHAGSIVVISTGGSVGQPVPDAPGEWEGRNPGFQNEPYEACKAALTNMSFFLAHELAADNIAVNSVLPAATRTTGSDEMVAGRAARDLVVSPLLRPEHVVPLVLHLAQQDARGITGRAIDAVQWNARHGFGAAAAWHWQPRSPT